jgi:hypothetical protein
VKQVADLIVQNISLGGVSPTFSAADSLGDTFDNGGKTFLHVKNGDTVSHTVTINSTKPCNYGFDHDESVSVAAGDEQLIGPFNSVRFNDQNNKVNVSYDAVTSVTVAAIKL